VSKLPADRLLGNKHIERFAWSRHYRNAGPLVMLAHPQSITGTTYTAANSGRFMIASLIFGNRRFLMQDD
jgi:hypothetical protein